MQDTLNNAIEVNSEVCFFEGKNNKNVAYDAYNKVILCKHKIPIGYARIKTVEEKDNFYLVTAEHITKDLYSDISYEEFLKVLPLHGYKIGFDRIFKHEADGDTIDEHQIFAYNPKNKAVIVGETFHWDKNDTRNSFNDIKIYLPGVNCFDVSRSRMFDKGSSNISVFDAGSTSYGECDILARMNNLVENYGGNWPIDEYPCLWTYEQDDNVEYDKDGNWILGTWSLQRLKLADPECLKIFEGCTWLDQIK